MSGAVSKELYDLIKELQSFDSLNSFALAGGTGLALYYNHRISIDIDLFSNKIIGIGGFELISKDFQHYFNDTLVSCEIINTESGNQYCFLRAFIAKAKSTVKVELIQNIQVIDPVELYKGIKLYSKRDIGLLKLMCVSNRKANKDVYDLDFITEEIPLNDLFVALEAKQLKFNQDAHKCLFDLDDELSPLDNITLLLEFDSIDYTQLSRPFHSSYRLDIVPPNKSWISAKANWRRKVRQYMKEKGLLPPEVKPVN